MKFIKPAVSRGVFCTAKLRVIGFEFLAAVNCNAAKVAKEETKLHPPPKLPDLKPPSPADIPHLAHRFEDFFAVFELVGLDAA